MAIRWEEFPHSEIRLKIYTRLGHSAVARSAEDSLRHILRRRLASLGAEDHRRFIELEARNLIEHLRCTRDIYREFVESKGCRPVLEAHWVVLRCAVFPTAIAILRQKVIDYAKFTRVPGTALSLLFGILTRTCYRNAGDGIALLCLPDIDDETAATDEELGSLSKLVNEDSLLWFRDIRDGGAVGRPLGGGPFSSDDAITIRNSFAVCGLRAEITLPDWVALREKLWNLRAPWTQGLCSLFGSVQEELLSQWKALPTDSLVHQLALKEQASSFQPIVVPAEEKLPLRLERGKDCEELAEEIGTIRHKRVRGGFTMDEIKNECWCLKIWKRVDALSDEDKDTFLHPGTWEPGYANLLLGKLYANVRRAVAPGTVNTWRKEYRAYLKWQGKNPSKTPGDFGIEMRRVKRSYRKPRPARYHR